MREGELYLEGTGSSGERIQNAGFNGEQLKHPRTRAQILKREANHNAQAEKGKMRQHRLAKKRIESKTLENFRWNGSGAPGSSAREEVFEGRSASGFRKRNDRGAD